MGKLLQFPQRIVEELPDLAVNAGPSSVRVLPVPEQDSLKLFSEYLRREKGASQNTVESYLSDLQQFEGWLARSGKTFEQAERIDIREYLAARMADGLSARSAARKLSTLRGLYRLLLDEERIRTNPTKGVPLPKTWKALPHFLELSDLETMLRWTESQRDALAIRDKAILLTLFASGLRESELINLKLADLDLEAGIVRVWNGKGGKDGLAPLSPPAIEALKAYLQKRNSETPYVFVTGGKNWKGSKLTRQALFYRIRDIARKSLGRDVGVHEFRHGCATALVKGGADIRDVQAVLRHSGIDTTQIYCHTDITYLRGIYDKSHPRA
jgi:site-specific recombinase XerD